MDFFGHQEEARKRTLWLIGLFTACVFAIILGIYLPVAFVSAAFGGHFDRFDPSLPPWWWQGELFFTVAAVLLVTMSGASWWKIRQLGQGGASVAFMLGGRLVDPETQNPGERRFLNVVEEMAIASGTPVPMVFVLPHEAGLNAFAAGYTLDDAAIAVTRGGIEQWTRDELQAVVAHEFSHILNGDMRLNIRLIGWLHGILFLTILGRTLVLMAAGGRRRPAFAFERQNRGGGKGAPQIIALGLLLMVVGSIGSFFARLIQSAISRQREYLADAAAVQFTRNPRALTTALLKVAGIQEHAYVSNPNAVEASHLFFGNPIQRLFWGNLFATHPPLRVRVERISPMAGHHVRDLETGSRSLSDVVGMLAPMKTVVDPQKERERRVQEKLAELTTARRAKEASAAVAPLEQLAGTAVLVSAAHGGQSPERSSDGQAGPEATLDETPLPTLRLTAAEVIAQIGTPGHGHLAVGHHLLSRMPDRLREAAHRMLGAVSLLYGLVLDTPGERRDAQLTRIAESEHPAVPETIRALLPDLDALEPSLRLPLLELTVPVLRALSGEQRQQFRTTMNAVIREDATLTLLQFTTRKIILRRMDRADGEGLNLRPQFFALKPLTHDLSLLLSVLGRAGTDDPQEALEAFHAGRQSLPPAVRDHVTPLGTQQCSYLQLNRALDRLDLSAPNIKQHVFHACVHTALADGIITVSEAELLRTLGECMDVPLPPILPTTLLEELSALQQDNEPAGHEDASMAAAAR